MKLTIKLCTGIKTIVPYGTISKDFIYELTLLINDWKYEADHGQHVAMKAFFLLQTVGLQKPSQNF